MPVYDPASSQSIYEEYLRTGDEKLIEPLLKSVEGLIDNVVHKEFGSYNYHTKEECRQDANILLLNIFKHKYVRLDGNYTSFLYEWMERHLRQ